MFTEKQIKKMPRKNLTPQQFVALAKRLNAEDKIDQNKLTPGNSGMFLGIHSFNGKKWYRLHLKSIWIKPFDLRYTVTQGNKRIGKELLISSLPIPRGPLNVRK